VIETDAHLDRKRGKPWDAHFIHRYDVAPEGEGSRITFTETIERVNYVPTGSSRVCDRSSRST
jgi:hypothetical protein